MIYNTIKDLTSAEICTFIKEKSQENDFLDKVYHEKEELIPFFLNHKAINNDILFLFLKKTDDLFFIMNSIKNSEFIPSLDFIEALINSCLKDLDSELLSLIQKLNSINLKIDHLFLILNNELVLTGEFLLLKNPSFSEPRILKIFISLKTENPQIIDLILESSKEIKDCFYDMMTENHLLNGTNIIHQIFKKNFFSIFNHKQFYDLFSKYNLNQESWEIALDNGAFKNREYSKFSVFSINYDPVLENENLFRRLRYVNLSFVNEVPRDSKFREKYAEQCPENLENDELISYISSNDCPSTIVMYALTLDLPTIKKINHDAFHKIAPADLRDCVKRQREREDFDSLVKYLLKTLSSKYSKYLREMISIEEANKVKGKKQSYFSEMLNALSRKDLALVKEIESYGYSLAQFSKDTFQKTKSEDSSRTFLSLDLMKQLTKDDLLILAESKIRFYGFYSEKIEEIIPFKFNKEELSSLSKQIDFQYLFKIAIKKEDVLTLIEEESDSNNIFQENMEEIIQNEKLLNLFLKKRKSQIVLDIDSFKKISKNYSKTFIKKNFIPDYCKSSLYLCLDKDNNYVYDLDDIISDIKENNDLIEDKETLKAIKIKDISFYEQLLNAYLKGNKDLSKVFGFDIKIRRSKVDDFKLRLENINKDNLSLLEKEYTETDKDYFLVKSLSKKISAEDEFEEFCNNRLFNINDSDFSIDNLERILEKHQSIELNIEELKISILDEEDFDKAKQISLSQVKIKKISIESRYYLTKPENLEKIKQISDKFSNSTIAFTTDELKILSLSLNLNFEGKNDFIANFSQSFQENLTSFSVELVPFYEKMGVIFDNQLLSNLITDNGELETLKWIVSRIGDLSFFTGEKSSFYDDEIIEFLIKNKATLLSDEDYLFREIKLNIIKNKEVLESIDISSLSLKQKTEIIFLLEKTIPEYKKLNLVKDNLEELKEILPLNQMVALSSFSDQELISLFKISKEISQNKKIINSFKDLIKIKGIPYLYKAQELNQLFEIKGVINDVVFSDFVDYSNPSELFFEDKFLKWDSQVIKKLTHLDLYFDSKKSVVRFLNSMLEHDLGYLNDIESMYNRIQNELENLKYKLNNTKLEENEKKDLDSSIKGIESRLIHVKGLDTAHDVHDRLVTLAGFIKEDPLQLIGQDKFQDLEKNNITQEFKYRLIFPKNRAEVQELGNEHGWCVSANSSYADGVISKKNVLVAVAPKDSDGSMKSALALAHFKNNGDGTFFLEQFRWSEKVKGKRNVSATNDFNYNYIKNLIETHLKTIKSKKNEK